MIYTTLVIVLSNLEQKMALLKFVAWPDAQSHLNTDRGTLTSPHHNSTSESNKSSHLRLTQLLVYLNLCHSAFLSIQCYLEIKYIVT